MGTRTEESKTYPAGERTVDAVQEKTSYHEVRLTFSREAWPADAGLLEVAVDRTLDEGKTWDLVGTAAYDGASRVDPRQPPGFAVSVWGSEKPRPGKVRCRILNKVEMKTAITLEVVEPVNGDRLR